MSTKYYRLKADAETLTKHSIKANAKCNARVLKITRLENFTAKEWFHSYIGTNGFEHLECSKYKSIIL